MLLRDEIPARIMVWISTWCQWDRKLQFVVVTQQPNDYEGREDVGDASFGIPSEREETKLEIRARTPDPKNQPESGMVVWIPSCMRRGGS